MLPSSLMPPRRLMLPRIRNISSPEHNDATCLAASGEGENDNHDDEKLLDYVTRPQNFETFYRLMASAGVSLFDDSIRPPVMR